MRDEDKFPTMRFITCRSCGQAYTASLSGVNSCPQCGTVAERRAAAGKRVLRTDIGKHILLTVTGPIYKIQEVEEVRGEVDDAFREQPESMAFHFDNASYLDSSMLSQLVRTVQEMTRRSRPTFVITGDAQVLESLQILDLDRVLTIYPTLEEYHVGLTQT